jgi:hypothetical protein
MCKWRKIELAWRKGMEVQGYPLMAEAYADSEPTMIRWIKNEK